MQDAKDTEKNPGNQAGMEIPKKPAPAPGTPGSGTTTGPVPRDKDDKTPVKKSA
jgi:hypothetical protein